jgi:ankyrin repeat protein
MTAWHGDNVPMLRLLLEHGGDPNAGDENTYPAFHEWMYEKPSKGVIELFLKHGADTTYVNDISRWTVLHYFASNGDDVEALDLLLQETPDGKKPDINYSENSSPLHLLLVRREVPRVLLQVCRPHPRVNLDLETDSYLHFRLSLIAGPISTGMTHVHHVHCTWRPYGAT